MKKIACTWILCLVFILAGCISANAAEETEFMRGLLDAEVPMNIQSGKLIGDLHQIMYRLRPVREGELEQTKTADLWANSQHSDEEPVSFLNTEFERMVRAAMGRDEEAPIYPSELAAIRSLSICHGDLQFSPKSQYDESYDQPCVLDLADLRLFPSLSYLNIRDMACSGFETVTELPDLRRLILIRTGLTDCGFLSGMELTELSLAGNELADFTPISAIKGLKNLNVTATGLDTLKLIRGMDLTVLVAADNPISDLDPISNMSGLTELYIQNTNITSLNALRDLMELEVLHFSDYKGEISLEPLYGHDNLNLLFRWGRPSNGEDRRKVKDGI